MGGPEIPEGIRRVAKGFIVKKSLEGTKGMPVALQFRHILRPFLEGVPFRWVSLQVTTYIGSSKICKERICWLQNNNFKKA